MRGGGEDGGGMGGGGGGGLRLSFERSKGSWRGPSKLNRCE